jgi:oligoendopeptidase F
MMDKAETDDERLYYLECAISMFAGTFFTQMMYSEFEDYMYKIVESG